MTNAQSDPGTYQDLKRQVMAAGLLNKSPARYSGKVITASTLLAASIALLFLTDSLWIQMANAVLMAVSTVQLCFIGHDAGHNQVFRSKGNNRRFGLLVSAVVGIGRTWWVEKHNRHHGNPNDLEEDPDVNLPLLAFSPKQARSKTSPVQRMAIRHQAILFYPLTCLEALVLKSSGLPGLLRHQHGPAEPLAILAHFAVYLGLVAWCLPLWPALAFITLHHAMTGFYISATFAPNHKGMGMTGPGSRPGFLRQQVLASRNVRPSRLNDFMYGGLNYQIEHHLSPAMPRHNLKRARPMVKEFCRQHGVAYHETGILGSQREILACLHGVGRSLSQPDPAAPA